MAKKITKEPNIKRYKAKCPICECEFEFDTTDAEWYIEESMDNFGEVWRTDTRCIVDCPKCKTTLHKCERIEK